MLQNLLNGQCAKQQYILINKFNMKWSEKVSYTVIIEEHKERKNTEWRNGLLTNKNITKEKWLVTEDKCYKSMRTPIVPYKNKMCHFKYRTTESFISEELPIMWK